MKKLFFLTWMLWMCGATIWAQVPKFRVSEWMLGNINNTNTISRKLDFSTGSPILGSQDYNCKFGPISNSISDSANNLLIYTNGVVLMNQDHNLIPGCENFNGNYYHPLDSVTARVPFTMLLPDPGNHNRFYVFHQSYGYSTLSSTMGQFLTNCRYSLIDLTMNNGQGGMIIKDSIWLKDTLTNAGYLSFRAVRHANGRDWWLLFPRVKEDAIYRVLLTPQGLS